MHKVYLSLGSNLGNRKLNLSNAITHLSDSGIIIDSWNHDDQQSKCISSIYETEHWSENLNEENYPNYFNIACRVKTLLDANTLLKKAGYPEGFTIELWQGNSDHVSYITEAIQEQLKKINIDVKIVKTDWNIYTQAINEGVPDMYYRSWYADYPNAENFLSPLFKTTISMKRWNRYSNPKLDS